MPIAATALLAGGAWLRARLQLDYDYVLLTSRFKIQKTLNQKTKTNVVNMFLSLEAHALHQPTADRTFLIYQERSWTFREAYTIVLKHGQWLKTKHGIKKRDVVAMDFTNTPTFIWLCLGLWSQGATPAFINYNITAEPLLHCIKTSGCRVILVEEVVRPQFPPAVVDALASLHSADHHDGVSAVFYDESTAQEIHDFDDQRAPDTIFQGLDIHGMAILIFTSGTTGLPKPAIVSWKKLWVGCSFFPHWCDLRVTDRFYTVSMLHFPINTLPSLVFPEPRLTCRR